MEQPGYYAIIPSEVRYDESLTPAAKLLYGEITALANREGFCWADNGYFARLYKVSNETVSRWISQLAERGFIEVEILQSEGNKRKITIDKKVNTSRQKNQKVMTKKSIPHDKKVNPIYENTTINITKNNIYTSAIDFFQKNAPSLYETFCMQHKQKIGADWDRFIEDFECKVIQEKLEYDVDVLYGRLRRLSNNWKTEVIKLTPADGVHQGPKRQVFKG